MTVVTASTAARPAAVHACIGCAALPEDARPRTPRKIDDRSRSGTYGGPRSLRCTTHYRAHRDAMRQRASDRRSRKRAGVDEDHRQAVLALQGGRCPCGASAGARRLNLNADHDHELAAGHDHPDDVACEDCFAGFTCHHCNREVIGFLSHGGKRTRAEVADALEALADYLRRPPAARLRAQLAAAPAA